MLSSDAIQASKSRRPTTPQSLELCRWKWKSDIHHRYQRSIRAFRPKPINPASQQRRKQTGTKHTPLWRTAFIENCLMLPYCPKSAVTRGCDIFRNIFKSVFQVRRISPIPYMLFKIAGKEQHVVGDKMHLDNQTTFIWNFICLHLFVKSAMVEMGRLASMFEKSFARVDQPSHGSMWHPL